MARGLIGLWVETKIEWSRDKSGDRGRNRSCLRDINRSYTRGRYDGNYWRCIGRSSERLNYRERYREGGSEIGRINYRVLGKNSSGIKSNLYIVRSHMEAKCWKLLDAKITLRHKM